MGGASKRNGKPLHCTRHVLEPCSPLPRCGDLESRAGHPKKSRVSRQQLLLRPAPSSGGNGGLSNPGKAPLSTALGELLMTTLLRSQSPQTSRGLLRCTKQCEGETQLEEIQ